MQQAGFGHFHAAGVAGMVVIEAQEVQRAMHDQMRQVMRHAPACRGRLPPDDAKRQHQFRRRMLIGQDVGGFIASAVPRIQLAAPAGRPRAPRLTPEAAARPATSAARDTSATTRGTNLRQAGSMTMTLSCVSASWSEEARRLCGSIILVAGLAR